MNAAKDCTKTSLPLGPMWPVWLVLFGLPLVLLLAKLPGMPISELVRQQVSLTTLPASVQRQMAYILFLPAGAVVVVLARLTLGLRVLGPFRSVLLAVAFHITGVTLGVVFLAATVGVIAGIRPSLRRMKLPYYGRITVMLSTVAFLMTVGVMAGNWFHIHLLQTVIYFPIVVLCLIADAFARTMTREGMHSALWRGGATILVAIVLTVLADSALLTHLLLKYPELLVPQIGAIIVVSRKMNWRLLERFNPKVRPEDKDDDVDDEENEHGSIARRFSCNVGV